MHLRNLLLKDAPFMLEWMHDQRVVKDLRGRFLSKTRLDAETFIREAQKGTDSIHLAICTEDDEYMGTVSLKCIDRSNQSAEFGIAVRYCAMGGGYAWFGMKEIFRKAFQEYQLKKIYWCVSEENHRAVRFYDKHHFQETMSIPTKVLNRYEGMNHLKWYSVSMEDNLAL